MRNSKNLREKGITLISLVVTIIVLLILSVVVLSQTVGIEGLIEPTMNSKSSYQIKEDRELIEITKQEVAQKNEGDIPKEIIKEKLNEVRFTPLSDSEVNASEELKGVDLDTDDFIVRCREHAGHYYKVTPDTTTYLGSLKDIPIIIIGDIDINAEEFIIPVKMKCENGIKNITLPDGAIVNANDYRTLTNGEATKDGKKYTEISFTYKVLTTGNYIFRATSLLNTTTRRIVSIGNQDLEIELDKSTWTQGPVTATVKDAPSNTQIKVINATTNALIQDWTPGNSYPASINCTVFAKVQNANNEVKYETKTITIIDKLAPTATMTVPSKTINSFDIKIVATDAARTSEYGMSGIKEIEYYITEGDTIIKTGSTSVSEDGQQTMEVNATINGLEVGTEYGYYCKVTDYAEKEYTTTKQTITTLHQYDIKYMGNGGKTEDDKTELTEIKTEGTAIHIASNTFIKEGYVFAGWNTDSNATTGLDQYKPGDNYYTNAPLTLYAIWTADKYTLTFDANSGSVIPANKQVTYDEAYGELPTPTRTGYTFAGWYTLADGGAQIEDTTIVKTAGAHTIYAHWTAITYTVTFNANSGSVTPENKEVTFDSTYGELPTPTRAGYIFAGWFTDITDGTQVTETTNVTTASDHTIYAHWTKAYYQNTTTNTLYITLAEAISGAKNGEQINVIANATEKASAENVAGKSIILNLNNQIVTFDGAYSLINKGTLQVIGSGKLIGSTAHTINNTGTLNIDMDNETAYNNGTGGIIANTWPRVTNTDINAIKNTGTLNINSGIIANEAKADEISSTYAPEVIYSTGTININGGVVRSISSKHYNQFGIYTTGVCNIKGGLIEAVGTALYTSGSKKTTITGGTIQTLWADTNNARGTINYKSTNILEISGTNDINITSASGQGIYYQNTGGITISNPNCVITGTTYGIQSPAAGTGAVTISAGTIKAKRGIFIYGDLIITGGYIKSTEGCAVNVYGTSSVTVSGDDTIIEKNGTGSGAIFQISSTGTGEINGGTIRGYNTTSNAVYLASDTTLTINGGSIEHHGTTQTCNGVTNASTNGTIIIKGGTIISDNGTGVLNDKTGTIIIGDDSNPVSTTIPSITGGYCGAKNKSTGTLKFYDGVINGSEGNSIIGPETHKPTGYRVVKTTEGNVESATLSNKYTVTFDAKGGSVDPTSKEVTYDATYGDLPTPTKTGYIFAGWFTSATDGDQVTNTTSVTTASNHTIYAHWTKAYYQNTTTNNLYVTLSEAVSSARTNEQIDVIANATEKASAENVAGKNIILNLNNQTVTFDGVYSLINKGTLQVIGSGKLTGSTAHTINNSGTLNIDMDNETAYNNGTGGIIANTWPRVTNTDINAIKNTGTLNINSGIVSNEVGENETLTYTPYAINSVGTLNMNGGVVRSISSNHYNQYGISTSGICNIKGGLIEAIGTALYTTGSKKTTITGGTIQSLCEDTNNRRGAINHKSTNILEISGTNDVNITSASGQGIYYQNTGGITISNPNCVITGTTYGIQSPAAGTGAVTISAGTITAERGIFIYGDLTITGGYIKSTVGCAVNVYGTSNVTVSGDNTIIEKNGTGSGAIFQISSTGTGEINGGTIRGYNTTSNAVLLGSNTTLTINGGSIEHHGTTQTCNGVTNASTNGTIIIKGGTIVSDKGIGVLNDNTGTIIIGDDSNPVLTTIPSITGGYCGAKNKLTGALKFYDGVINGSEGNSIIGPETHRPEGYRVVKTIVGNVESATLSNAYTLTINHYLENANDNEYTLIEGLDASLKTANVTYGDSITLENLKTTVQYGENLASKKANGVEKTTHTITGDTTIDLYYARDRYELILDKNEYIQETIGGGEHKVGETVQIDATVFANTTLYTYTWDKWVSSDTSLMPDKDIKNSTITMPESDVTLTATATRSENAPKITKFTKINEEINLFDNDTNVTKFEVEVSGLNLSYQWYCNDVAIPGATSSSYSITRGSMTESGIGTSYLGGTFNCVITNDAGTTNLNDMDVEGEKLGKQQISYTIENATQMKNFAKRVNDQGITFATLKDNGSYFDNTIKEVALTANVDLENASWTSIGDYGTDNNLYFAGTFNGEYNGVKHSISNLYINTNQNYQGLFGKVTGTIKNVGIESGNITGGDITGAIAGIVEGGTIERCYNKATINAEGYAIGGICGNLNNGTIKETYNEGSITGNITVTYGSTCGIAGKMSGSSIEKCYNSGNILSYALSWNPRAAGITDWDFGNDGTKTILNCYNSGEIKIIGEQYFCVAAGIIGQVLSGMSIDNCYNVGKVIVQDKAKIVGAREGAIAGYNDQASKITNCYWLENSATVGIADGTASGCIAEVRSEEYMKTSYFVTDLNAGASNWKIVAGMNEGYPILDWQTEANGITVEFETVSTAQALKDFAMIVNDKKVTFAGKPEVKLTQDIDLSSVCGEGKENWTPIGDRGTDNTLYFEGTFNGQGKTIRKIYINTSKNEQGLFGFINNGIVKNVTVNGQIIGNSNIGGITGRSNGTIENCVNNASIQGNGNAVGGISGLDYGTIEYCINNGNVTNISTTTGPTGGIAGWKSYNNICNCINNGTISSNTTDIIGGITGLLGNISGILANGMIDNCYNTGNITGKTNVGGIIAIISNNGGNGIVKNCYSIGSIQNKNSKGSGIVTSRYSGTIENTYYLEETAIGGIGSNDVPGSAEAKYGVYMKTSEFVNLLNAGGSNWKLVDGKNDNFPVLSWEGGTAVTRDRFGEITNKSAAGYDVYCYASGERPDHVTFPTWSGRNDQDDILWLNGTKLEDGLYYFRVNTSDHNNETGTYVTHIYYMRADKTTILMMPFTIYNVI